MDSISTELSNDVEPSQANHDGRGQLSFVNIVFDVDH